MTGNVSVSMYCLWSRTLTKTYVYVHSQTLLHHHGGSFVIQSVINQHPRGYAFCVVRAVVFSSRCWPFKKTFSAHGRRSIHSTLVLASAHSALGRSRQRLYAPSIPLHFSAAVLLLAPSSIDIFMPIDLLKLVTASRHHFRGFDAHDFLLHLIQSCPSHLDFC